MRSERLMSMDRDDRPVDGMDTEELRLEVLDLRARVDLVEDQVRELARAVRASAAAAIAVTDTFVETG